MFQHTDWHSQYPNQNSGAALILPHLSQLPISNQSPTPTVSPPKHFQSLSTYRLSCMKYGEAKLVQAYSVQHVNPSSTLLPERIFQDINQTWENKHHAKFQHAQHEVHDTENGLHGPSQSDPNLNSPPPTDIPASLNFFELPLLL